jgi:predicted transposase/invertase (TIGR01784 family)
VKRDSIFFQIFQQSPMLLFDLLPGVPENADRYRFASVAVKEPKFEIDGVFLPPDDRPGVVYYAEVQFQRDERLYERVVSESSNHFYRNRDQFTDWQAAVIYPSRSMEQKDTYPYRALLNSDQFHRIYLNELGDIRELPLGLALMRLTIEPPKKAPEAARYLLARSKNEIRDPQANRAIMEMLTTIMVYRFNKLSRSEVEEMLGTRLEKSRFYQEVKAEGEVIGQERGQRSLLQAQLDRKFGKLSSRTKKTIAALDQTKLESLAIALLDFTTIGELEAWLRDSSI